MNILTCSHSINVDSKKKIKKISANQKTVLVLIHFGFLIITKNQKELVVLEENKMADIFRNW